MSYISATYDPADNKLRLSASSRLDKDEYDRVRAAGFIWAPKQGIFVAPMWTPEREDLALELAGEIDDEDTSLVDRAEQRAERFEDYSEKRADDAERARAAVDRIADGIPFGQPILVGHHSERHARRDAEKIRSGMERTVRMWETSKYWEARAAGALQHAKYLERPDVRHRRIKGLTSDKRKFEKQIADAENLLKLWNNPEKELTRERALAISNISGYDSRSFPLKDFPRDPPASQYEGSMGIWSAIEGNVITPEQAKGFAVSGLESGVVRAARWLAHTNNRLAYELAMLGTPPAAKWENVKVGGRVLVGDEWCIVLKVNKAGGNVNSFTTNRRYMSVVGVELVKDYREPEASEVAAVKAATKLPPLVNFKGEGFAEMTKAEYDQRAKYQSAYARVEPATENYGKHRQRYTIRGGSLMPLFVTDLKITERPPVSAPVTIPARVFDDNATPRPVYVAPEPTEYDAMKESLRAGVKVVSAPQLFPTPPDVAEKAAEIADIRPGDDVLEPNVGTCRLLDAFFHLNGTGRTVAVEINYQLAAAARAKYPLAEIISGDFLEQNGNLGKFDRVIMNPPFENGSDIKHIQHALRFLKPGGKLVAICANGSRQAAAFQSIADTWEVLPRDTFRGTSVSSVLFSIKAVA